MTLAVGAAELPTVTASPADVVTLATSSVAFAVRVCAPFAAAALFHDTLHGSA